MTTTTKKMKLNDEFTINEQCGDGKNGEKSTVVRARSVNCECECDGAVAMMLLRPFVTYKNFANRNSRPKGR